MNVQEKIRAHMARPRSRTTDARRITVQERIATRDTLLSAEPGKLNPDLHGLAWTGESLAQVATGMIRDMTRDAQVQAVRKMRDALDDLETEFASDEWMHKGAGPFGSTSTGATQDRLNTRATPTSINQAQARFWSERRERPVDRIVQARDNHFASNGRVSVADINSANKRFHDKG